MEMQRKPVSLAWLYLVIGLVVGAVAYRLIFSVAPPNISQELLVLVPVSATQCTIRLSQSGATGEPRIARWVASSAPSLIIRVAPDSSDPSAPAFPPILCNAGQCTHGPLQQAHINHVYSYTTNPDSPLCPKSTAGKADPWIRVDP